MSEVPPPTSFGHHMLRGSIWMIAMRWAMRVIGVFSTIILARLLLPADFGIVAMALLVLGLLETIAYTGVDFALIRDSKATREHYDSAWTIKIIQGLIIACALIVAAPFAAEYFDEPRVTTAVRLLAVYALVDSWQNIGVVAFRVELDFAKEFRFNLYKKLINFVVIVALALAFRNYLALVVGMISSAMVTVWLSYVMHPYRPKITFSRVREIWAFSKWLLVSGVSGYVNAKADQIVVGGTVGTSAMGSYHVAHEIATMPTSEVVLPIRRAFYPTLSKLVDAPAAFREAVQQTYATVAVACCALGFGLAAVADHFVLAVLGEQWLASIPVLRWLALFGTLSALGNVLGIPIMVMGQTRLLAFRSWFQLVCLVPVVYLSTTAYGVEGAAAGRAAVALAFVPIMIFAATRVCSLRLADFFSVLWRPLLAGALMATAVSAVELADSLLPIVPLAVKVLLGAALYPVLLLLLWTVAGRPHGVESRAVQWLVARRTRTVKPPT